MKKSVKGVLLSGLVFPGLGQIVLKYYTRGIVLIITVSGCLMVIVVIALQTAFSIIEKIELEGGAIDLNTITNAAARASATSHSLIYNLSLLFIVCCWIFGPIYAYRIGKKIER